MTVDAYDAVREHLDGLLVAGLNRTLRKPADATGTDVPIHYDELADTGDYQVCLLGLRGRRPQYGIDGSVTIRKPQIEIITYAPTAGEGRTLAIAIRNRMDELRSTEITVGGETSTVTSTSQDSQPELQDRTDDLAAIHLAGMFDVLLSP